MFLQYCLLHSFVLATSKRTDLHTDKSDLMFFSDEGLMTLTRLKNLPFVSFFFVRYKKLSLADGETDIPHGLSWQAKGSAEEVVALAYFIKDCIYCAKR